MLHRTLVFVVVFFISVQCFGANFELKVTDTTGALVSDAVVTLKSAAVATGTPTGAPLSGVTIQVSQQGKDFIPFVSIIPVGSLVEFPNHDTVQHHVYSFSKAKRFDLPLYKDATPKPVLFDTPGVVSLGCNIHDWMKAYIYVSDTPYFAKSGPDGLLKIGNLPAGEYQVTFWHPRLKKVTGNGLFSTVTIEEKKDVATAISVELRKEVLPSRTPKTEGGGYE